MISSLEIKQEASYDEAGQTMDNLRMVNFVFGSNGSGKTTISRVIDGDRGCPECNVSWTGPTLETRVYNRDFVEANFSQTNSLKGIFTLGEESTELVKEIDETKAELDQTVNKIANFEAKLNGEDGNSGKLGERLLLANEFNEGAWTYKKKYEDEFRDALTGTMGKKTEFSARLRKEAQNKNNITLQTREELLERAASVYADDLAKFEFLNVPEITGILELEKSPILAKKVIGKQDVDIAAMIQKLGNSDWVREGLNYHKENVDVCPFCQQKTDEAFGKSLAEYFDETYLGDLDAIKVLSKTYTEYASQIEECLKSVIEAEVPFIELSIFRPQKELFGEKVAVNQSVLERKLDEPSTVVQLESLNGVLDTLVAMITEANKKIREHNDIVDNSSAEQKKLQAEIWRLIVEDAQLLIDTHNQKEHKLEKAIEGLKAGLEALEIKRVETAEKLAGLEKRGTSINASIADINKTLSDFGFKGFSLAVADKPGYYKIVRLDGQDAHDSLSEGEKTFVTFLYFFHLLKGSQSQTGVKSNRIAVFDDPVSSLDSEVLFIVSTLIKSVIASIAEGGPVKQVILLTHNMYFFKEVSFKSTKQQRKEDGQPNTTYSFWTVTKRNEVSQIERHDKNPIKSAYQMLWDEVKKEDASRHTIRNTLRRILEYYFTTIGSQSLDDLPANFVGNEQSICRSLISWVHEGSHFTDDDYTVVPSIETVDRQKAVFKRIFEETKHIAHYEMMMGDDDSAHDGLENVSAVA